MGTTEMIIAGFGGQGILYMGQMLSYAANDLGKKVSWLPSYGPEMRGGTANCMVCISDEDINSPLVLEPDVLVAMNKPSLVRFEKTVKPGGTLVLNRDMIDIEPTRGDTDVYWIPADAIASELGNPKIANMVALGALIGALDIVTLEQAVNTVGVNTPASKADTLSINLEALRRGCNIAAIARTKA
jgi:2-oxoglutarate ferredoxin oxidoreductase subunit gamma